MDTWSDEFFRQLGAGKTAWDALAAAKSKVYAVHGSYGGTNEFVTFGNTSIKVVPAGYGS